MGLIFKDFLQGLAWKNQVAQHHPDCLGPGGWSEEQLMPIRAKRALCRGKSSQEYVGLIAGISWISDFWGGGVGRPR